MDMANCDIFFNRLQQHSYKIAQYKDKLELKQQALDALMEDVITKEPKKGGVNLRGVDDAYFRDLTQACQRLHSSVERLSGQLGMTRENFSVRNTILMSLEQSKLNEAVGKLTACTMIFAPLTFIAGLWGMNCVVPWQAGGSTDAPGGDPESESIVGFCILTSAMCLMGVLMFLTLRAQKLL